MTTTNKPDHDQKGEGRGPGEDSEHDDGGQDDDGHREQAP